MKPETRGIFMHDLNLLKWLIQVFEYTFDLTETSVSRILCGKFVSVLLYGKKTISPRNLASKRIITTQER